ncbi:TetR/AcrR family transcriptional regulator [Fulvivirga sp. M361]|nr:TetR/AcrR family transcriptional regulator [Fulvivirga sp. M361]
MDTYKDYVLTNGSEPASVFQFMKGLKLPEEEFYKYFGSFKTIKTHIWKAYMIHTLEILKNDNAYQEYTVREKLLAFYYTLMEVLKKDRSYIMYSFKGVKKPELSPSFLKSFKEEYQDYIHDLIAEGLDSEEIIKRPILSDRYHDALWIQLVFIVNFWLRDDTTNFQQTDAAIEKTVNLSIELMGRGPLDMMVDFAKFLYQSR